MSDGQNNPRLVVVPLDQLEALLDAYLDAQRSFRVAKNQPLGGKTSCDILDDE